MRAHHRKIAYRPPRRRETSGEAGFALFARFARAYLMPRRRALLVCALLVSLNACSVYLMAYYSRIVVDTILVIRPSAPHAAVAPGARRDDRPLSGIERTARLPRGTTVGLPEPGQRPGAAFRLGRIFVLYVLTLVTLNLLSRLSQRTRIQVDRDLTAGLRNDIHRKVLELSLAYHKIQTPGRLLSRITSDVEVLQQQLVGTVLMAVQSVVMVLVGGVVLFAADWRLCLIAASVLPVYAWLYIRARPPIREVNRELRHTNAWLYGYVSQKLDAVKAIQAYAREGLERLHWNRLAACFLRDAVLQNRLNAGFQGWAQIISGIGTGAVFLVGAREVMGGHMTIGAMLYAYGVAASLFGPVLQLAQLSIMYNNLLVVMHRVAEVFDRPLEIVDAPDAIDFPQPLRRGISIQHVAFTYTAEPEDEPVLRDVSIEIPAGTWLCVMGPSGAGKTTLLYMLTRLYEPSSGGIFVDGAPLSRVRLRSLRQRIGFVPQEAQIFSGSVRDNITYGFPDAEPRDIVAAARAAEMHDFIMQMPVQYETLIGEKGISLSGGQRQRLSLARALLTNPEVLILDDCTSALDADTERRIQETLASTLMGKTAVIVSQRVSMAMRCHRIVTIENGTVSECGTHEELLRLKGFYARLHAQQTE